MRDKTIPTTGDHFTLQVEGYSDRIFTVTATEMLDELHYRIESSQGPQFPIYFSETQMQELADEGRITILKECDGCPDFALPGGVLCSACLTVLSPHKGGLNDWRMAA